MLARFVACPVYYEKETRGFFLLLMPMSDEEPDTVKPDI